MIHLSVRTGKCWKPLWATRNTRLGEYVRIPSTTSILFDDTKENPSKAIDLDTSWLPFFEIQVSTGNGALAAVLLKLVASLSVSLKR